MTSEQFSRLPEKSYSALQSNKSVVCNKRGESGYYIRPEEQRFNDFEDAKKFASLLNERIGVTPQQSAAMEFGAMFRWDSPAADPQNYDENGMLLKPENRPSRHVIV